MYLKPSATKKYKNHHLKHLSDKSRETGDNVSNARLRSRV